MVAVDLEIWGKRGEAFAKHIDSKTPVAVEGRLKLDRWESDGKALRNNNLPKSITPKDGSRSSILRGTDFV